MEADELDTVVASMYQRITMRKKPINAMQKKGGKATLKKYGKEHFKKLGNKTLKKYGKEHYRKLALARWAKTNASKSK